MKSTKEKKMIQRFLGFDTNLLELTRKIKLSMMCMLKRKKRPTTCKDPRPICNQWWVQPMIPLHIVPHTCMIPYLLSRQGRSRTLKWMTSKVEGFSFILDSSGNYCTLASACNVGYILEKIGCSHIKKVVCHFNICDTIKIIK